MENFTQSVFPTYTKRCMVPLCTNTTKTAPDKVFFNVPREEKVRRMWCKMMKRNFDISAAAHLNCCEDHFMLEEDTQNYMEYKIMALQEGNKVRLRLKTGTLPHIFRCQKGNVPSPPKRLCVEKRERQRLVREALEPTASTTSLEHDILALTSKDNSTTQPATHTSQTEKSQLDKAIQVKDKHTDKAVQVRAYYRSIGVNITPKYKNVAINHVPKCKDSATSPFGNHLPFAMNNVSKSHQQHENLISYSTVQAEAVNLQLSSQSSQPMSSQSSQPMSSQSSQPVSSQISSEYVPQSTPSESSWSEDELKEEKDKEFKNLMRSGMLASIEREPKLLLGLRKECYYLILLLSYNIPAPTINILITLKKIKLNESFDIIGLQFGYSQSTVSRIFSSTIPMLKIQMKDLIVWPTQTEIRMQLPISFRARYVNVVSIIDCLEIEIEKPSDAVHQALTWSQYKKCNTLKYLISCTPDGLVSFVSEGYGGRASDVTIVKDCGYLERLPLDSAVMADRGFKDLSCLLEEKKCELIRPPSVYSTKASTKDEVKESKRIAALRIHVERVINRLRNFHMLLPHACVDHHLIPLIDDVIQIACGIINMLDVLIKK